MDNIKNSTMTIFKINKKVLKSKRQNNRKRNKNQKNRLSIKIKKMRKRKKKKRSKSLPKKYKLSTNLNKILLTILKNNKMMINQSLN